MKSDYKVFGRPTLCQAFSIFIGVSILIVSLGLWVVYPPVYKSETGSQLTLSEDEAGGYSESAFYWANAPSHTTMNFYVFIVSNGDEIEMFGEQPKLIEIGPFSIIEKEKKKEVEFSDDGRQVHYVNYKTFIYDGEKSCDVCDYNMKIRFPNLILIGALADISDPTVKISKLMQSVLAIGIYSLGEYPFVNVPFSQLVFDGYEDSLLTFGNSLLYKDLNKMFGKNGKDIFPFKIPDMAKMGIFYGYNNTNDGDYIINTGKDDIDNLGKIISWRGSDMLPDSWWSTNQTRMINGTDSGSFQHRDIQNDDVLPQFQSYLCRSFELTYQKDSEVEGIPSKVFTVPYEGYDTTLKENKGFRYSNHERTNYYPNWPNCDDVKGNCTDATNLDCSIKENLCSPCCSKSFVNGTYLLPPGMYPVACYPGRYGHPPFLMIFSAPHFVYSPLEVTDSLYGISPNIEIHRPIIYNHEPNSGQVVGVNYKFQVNVPIFQNSHTIINANMPNKIIPIFWASTDGRLFDSVLDRIRFGFVTVPNIIFFCKFGSLFIGVLVLALVLFVRLRTK